MNDPAPVSVITPASPNQLGLFREWIAGAWRIFRQDPWLWVTMAVLFFAVAILLKRIPLMGSLVVILLAPIPLAGALLAAREILAGRAAPAGTIPATWPERWRFLMDRPYTALTRALRQENAAFSLAFLCVVTLGVVIAVVMFEYLVAGGSVISGIGGARYSGSGVRLSAMIGGAVAVAAYAALLGALFHLVPLVLFGGRLPLPALVESLLAWRRAPIALVFFVAVFVVAYVPFAIAFSRSSTHWLGYLMVFTLGTVLLPLFVIGNYLSFRALHGDTAAPAQP